MNVDSAFKYLKECPRGSAREFIHPFAKVREVAFSSYLSSDCFLSKRTTTIQLGCCCCRCLLASLAALVKLDLNTAFCCIFFSFPLVALLLLALLLVRLKVATAAADAVRRLNWIEFIPI